MRPEASTGQPAPKAMTAATGSMGEVEWLAQTLLELAGDQTVRVIEAVAAAVANRGERPADPAEPGATCLAEPGTRFVPEAAVPLEVCRRIARRALRGSLSDPTDGATAFHRVDENPAWTRAHLPVAVAGPFLFYRA